MIDPQTGEDDFHTAFQEHNYTADSTGIGSLYDNNSTVKQGGISITVQTNGSFGAVLPENNESGTYLAQFAISPSELPYIRSHLFAVHDTYDNPESFPVHEYFEISSGHTLTSVLKF